MLLNPIFFVLDQIARVVSIVDHRLEGSPDNESDEAAQLARDVEAVMPTIERGKARLQQMRSQLPAGTAFVDAYRQELSPLASGIRLVATNQWISPAEDETWNRELDNLLIPFLGF